MALFRQAIIILSMFLLIILSTVLALSFKNTAVPVDTHSLLVNLAILFLIITAVGLIILNLLIRTILKPLKEIQKQISAIAQSEFIIQDKIPYTKELKEIVLEVNNMVLKVKTMLNEGKDEIKIHRELEYIDQTTGVKNRKYLIDRLPEYLKVDATAESGINIILALSGMIEANERIGHKNVDKFFIDIANILKISTGKIKNSIVARLNGTEFSLLLPACSAEEAVKIAQDVQCAIQENITEIGLDRNKTFVSIGLCEYLHTYSIAQLLSYSDNALAQAKFSKDNLHLEKAQSAVEVMGKEAWRLIIKNAINKNRFNFSSSGVLDTNTKKVLHNVLSINLRLDKHTSYSYARFMAPAIQANLSCSIYKNVVNMLFNTHGMLLGASIYSLRLPYEYLELEETYSEIGELLRANAYALPFKLIIEISDKVVRQNSKYIKQYKELFQEYNVDIGIYEFIGESSDLEYLRDFKPVYIKSEGSYFLSQSSQSLSALRLIADTMGISLIAVGVVDTKTVDALKSNDIYIIQGKATELLDIE